MIEATCEWGDGPDVMVSLNGTKLILYQEPLQAHFTYGVIEEGSFDLTVEEAEAFAGELMRAAKQARYLNS